MPLAKRLSSREKTEILRLKEDGQEQKEIGRELNRSQNVISTILRGPYVYGQRKIMDDLDL